MITVHVGSMLCVWEMGPDWDLAGGVHSQETSMTWLVNRNGR